MKNITAKNLEIILDKMEKEEIKELVLDLYKSNKIVKESINILLNGNEYGDELLEEYKNKLYKVFNPSDIVRVGFSLSEAKNILSDFKDRCINDNGKMYGDLSLYFAECAMEFTLCYGDIDDRFYKALVKAFHEATVIANENKELFDVWENRFVTVLRQSEHMGWGVEKYLSEDFDSIQWIDM